MTTFRGYCAPLLRQRRIFLLYAAIAVISGAMAACGYVPFTYKMRKDGEDALGKVQLYLSEPIELKRADLSRYKKMRSKPSPAASSDNAAQSFAAKLPGLVMIEECTEDGKIIALQLDTDKDAFLLFERAPSEEKKGEDWYYLTGEQDGKRFFVTYRGKNDYEVLAGHSAYLLVKRSDKPKASSAKPAAESKKNKAGGMKIK